MLVDSININNVLQFSSLEIKLVKSLKIFFFEPNLHKKGVIVGYDQNEKQCFWQK